MKTAQVSAIIHREIKLIFTSISAGYTDDNNLCSLAAGIKLFLVDLKWKCLALKSSTSLVRQLTKKSICISLQTFQN